MAVENFTTYTEVDSNSRLAVTSSRITWTDLQFDDTAYVYKDDGVDSFDGDFTVLLTLYLTAIVASAQTFTWTLANDVGTLKDISDANGDALSLRVFEAASPPDKKYINVRDIDSGVGHNGNVIEVSTGTIYYLKIVRDESVGTYGTLYCYIYTDPGRTILLGTSSLTLSSKKDFRYFYAITNWGGTGTNKSSGYVENYEIFKSIVAIYSSDAVARVSSIRHIFRPGFFRMQVALGDLGFDVDVAEATVRRELDTAKDDEADNLKKTIDILNKKVEEGGYGTVRGVYRAVTDEEIEAWKERTGWTGGFVPTIRQTISEPIGKTPQQREQDRSDKIKRLEQTLTIGAITPEFRKWVEEELARTRRGEA